MGGVIRFFGARWAILMHLAGCLPVIVISRGPVIRVWDSPPHQRMGAVKCEIGLNKNWPWRKKEIWPVRPPECGTAKVNCSRKTAFFRNRAFIPKLGVFRRRGRFFPGTALLFPTGYCPHLPLCASAPRNLRIELLDRVNDNNLEVPPNKCSVIVNY